MWEEARAIGIVQKNDYADLGKNEDSRIHVLWINKSDEKLAKVTRQDALEKVEPHWKTLAAFKEAVAYRRSFDLIDRLSGNSTANEPESNPYDQQSGVYVMKNPHPLNQILYGPPGTGKTWNTVDYSLAIIEDEPLDVIEKKESRR